MTVEPEQQPTCYRHKNLETRVSCSNCGNPICTDCMIFGPVGIRCPDCSGKQAGKPTLRKQKPSLTRITSSDIVTRSIVSLVVLVYIAQVAESGSISGTGQLIVDGALYGPSVKAGEWWRLITSAFLHSGPIHLIFNALILWWFGRSLENLIGSRRFLGLYAISLLAGAVMFGITIIVL